MARIHYLADGSIVLEGAFTLTDTPVNPTDVVNKAYVDAAVGAAGKKYATVLVSPDPGVGDYTDIQAAVDDLPAEGGLVLMREGVYPRSVKITVPAGKDVAFLGCGAENTVIDIETNIITAFEIQGQEDYSFTDFTIIGRGLAGQIGFSHTAPSNIDPARKIVMRNLRVGNAYPAQVRQLEKAFVKVSGGAPFNIDMTDVDVRVIGGGVLFADGGTGGTLDMVRCRTTGSVSGGAVTAIRAVNSVFSTNGNIDVAVFNVVNCITSVATLTIRSITFITTSYFGLTGSIILEAGADNSRIVGSYFVGIGAMRILDLVAGADRISVVGCKFEGFIAQAMRSEGRFCTFTGNENFLVFEAGLADENNYSGNRGFAGSTIIGVNTLVDGSQKQSDSGATTGSFVVVMGRSSINGMTAIGTIKNTGGNTMEVKETVTDDFGVTDTVTTPILAGNDYMLDAMTNFATARPPFKNYQVEVRHTGSATTYSLRHVAQGAVR